MHIYIYVIIEYCTVPYIVFYIVLHSTLYSYTVPYKALGFVAFAVVSNRRLVQFEQACLRICVKDPNDEVINIASVETFEHEIRELETKLIQNSRVRNLQHKIFKLTQSAASHLSNKNKGTGAIDLPLLEVGLTDWRPNCDLTNRGFGNATSVETTASCATMAARHDFLSWTRRLSRRSKEFHCLSSATCADREGKGTRLCFGRLRGSSDLVAPRGSPSELFSLGHGLLSRAMFLSSGAIAPPI